MKTDIFDFYIPEHLIAQKPVAKRSDSRLLVYHKDRDMLTESFTKNVGDFLSEEYFLVFNNSRVIPARFRIIKKDNGREGEFLVLKITDRHKIDVLTDRSKKYKEGSIVILPDGSEGTISESKDDLVKTVCTEKDIFSHEYFEKYGSVPLPPYIKKGIADNYDRERYQTVYTKYYGSAAAPTAGLHFDDSIFNSLEQKKISHAFVSLHVGLGTFQPIYADEIEDHKIHEEEYFIEEAEAKKINAALDNGKKIIPVGTTSLRTLETAFEEGIIKAGKGASSLYIRPSYEFKIASGLFTNFHTPRSSLAVLVSAMIGTEKLLEIYKYAVEKEYRFFSYGDAMLII